MLGMECHRFAEHFKVIRAVHNLLRRPLQGGRYGGAAAKEDADGVALAGIASIEGLA